MLRRIYMKEMKDSFRDRRTLFLIVLLPILMMSGLTFFYENMLSDDKGETYQLAVNQGADEEILTRLSSYENVTISKTSDPAQMVSDGDALAGLIIGENFMESVENGGHEEVTVIGDSFSQKSSSLIAIVTTEFTSLEKEITAQRLEAQGTDLSVIQPFTMNQQELSEDLSVNMLALLVPLILAIAIGIGASPSAVELFAGEKEKKTMEALLMTPVNRSTLVLAKWLAISTLSTLMGFITLSVMLVEISFFTEKLKEAISFGENLYPIAGLSLMVILVYAVFNSSIMMITSIMGKTVKEAQSYYTPVSMLAMFPGMIISSLGVNELEVHHFAIPILNLFSQMKELLFGIVDYQHLAITISSNLIVMLVVFIIGRILFLKDKWVLN
ncbi:ABC transporter permease [Rossellomorea aquimaris]|uniref:ABC transporter permease n=1 Tax=Rossellomorea aquimaris TaxID=189382 RepID=UPI001CD2A152|nr:ABC transporter permease [Rossellomorea aquimaris]MCA1055713.1 ABC transporter permease [Rossellomorea aquimaris]